MRINQLLVTLAAAGSISAIAAANPTIASLGVLSGGTYSYAYALSADGSVVTGYADPGGGVPDRAVRWTAAGGLQDLGVLPGGDAGNSGGSGVSASGGFITGTSRYGDGTHGFRWNLSTGQMEDIGELSGGSFHSSGGHGISSDGNTIVGNSYSSIGYRAFRWTASGGIESMGELAGGSNSNALAVSGDGQVATGISDSISGTRAFRWTSAGGMQNLGVLNGAGTSYGWAINGDGSVIVGKSDPFGTTMATRWTQATGLQSLGLLPGSPYSSAQSVSADGNKVVGVSALPGFSGYHGFLWTSAMGMVDLNTYLPTLGLDLTGWTLSQALAISADGNAIAGYGLLNGQVRGWVVHLTGSTPPCAADLGRQGGLPGADGVLDNNDFIAFINYFFNHDTHADLGVQGGGSGSDGQFDNNDFIAFISEFFAGC